MKISILSIFKWRPVFCGAIGTLFFLHISLLPSLLPRPWLLQGFVTGTAMAIGYGLGLALSSIIRWFSQKELPKDIKKLAWNTLYIAFPIIATASLFSGRKWQDEVRSLLGVESISSGYLVFTILISCLFFIIWYWVGRGTRNFARYTQRFTTKRLPKSVGVGLGGVASTLLVYFIVSGLFMSNFYRFADSKFARRNDSTRDGVSQPASPEKSGSPSSLIKWDELGYQGRVFVGQAPSKIQIEKYTNKPAKEPVRIYSGMQANNDPLTQADLAVKDLKRAGGFNRKVLVIATATGSGWINPRAVDPLEYMFNGDSAIVTQQYSYLPSWISFLVDKSRAETAGRVLFDAVVKEWDSLPANNRPQLYVYGLSLGSLGGNEAFTGVNSMTRSVNGVLFEGTPNDTRVWREINRSREKGSPEYKPIFRGGRNVAFASDKQDIIEAEKNWAKGQTRILYMQHANDPVVWFSFDLIFNQPDWLKEKRGPRVSPSTHYYPIVTFLQIGVDQMIGNSAPVGNGHLYDNTGAYEWAAVAQPTGWTLQDSDKLQKFIDSGVKH